MTDDHQHNIILFPDFAELQEEVEQLRTELSMLLLERDELLLVECQNIETAYMLAVGHLEYKAYELHCVLLRLKRKVELIQAKKNRQETIVLSKIEALLDAEFAKYQQQLEEQLNQINQAIVRHQCPQLSQEETRELKQMYRMIVKQLHPDLNPDISSSQMSLFHNAVSAYENGDLNTMRLICTLLPETSMSPNKENALSTLKKEKERLKECVALIRDDIHAIKADYPYTMKELVQNKEKIAEKQAELEGVIEQLRESIGCYTNKIEEMLR